MSLSIVGRGERLQHLLPELHDLRITGFQSPAEDEREASLCLNKLTGVGAPQIWELRVEDTKLLGFGFFPGDVVVVDRSAPVKDRSLVVIDTEGDYLRMRLVGKDSSGAWVLKDADPNVPPITVGTEECITVWGVAHWCLSYVGVP